MKKALKIIGIVLLVIVVLIGALVIWKWPYVSALIDGMTKSAEELGQIRVEDTEKTISGVNSHMDSELRDMTDEEREKIKSGELSQTEVMAQIVAEATGIELPDASNNESGNQAAPEQQPPQQQPSQQTEQGQTSTAAPTEPKPAASDYDQLVAGCVSKLYSLQSQYTGQLAALVSRARSYYNQQKSSVGEAAAKSSTAAMVQGEVASMEGACDSKVEAALGELSSSLKAIGADTSIVGELRAAYEREKKNQRRAYVNRYMN